MLRHDRRKPIGEELLGRFLLEAEEDRARKERLFEAYLGKSTPDKGMIAEGRPNNHAYTNFAKYITDTATGYFAGAAPRYVFDDETEAGIFKRIFDENDESSLNYSLAESMSICGTAYDIIFLDEEAKIRIEMLDPREITPIYGEELGQGMIAAAREFMRYENGSWKRKGELYTEKERIFFENDGGRLRFTGKENNILGMLPITEYENNLFKMGDFEACMENIGLYNLLLSNASDDLQSIANAYLAISGMLGTTKEDIERMNETRIALLTEDGKMEFITKDLDASAIENQKMSLRRDILQVAGIPDLSDERFYSGLSGAAMEYRLWALDQLRAKKQAGMDKGLFARLKKLAAMLNLRFANISSIEKRTSIIYTRNMPKDEGMIAETAGKLQDLVSKKTILHMVEPLTKVSAEDEEKRISEEKQSADCAAKSDATM